MTERICFYLRGPLLVFLALLLFGMSANATEEPSAQQPATEEAPTPDFSSLTDLLNSAAASLDGASLLLIKDGQVVCEQSVGNMSPDKPVAIASASKWLTAAVVMTLVDDGRIVLDDPVAKYLPAFNGGKAGITIRELLSHTSGLPDYAPCLDNRQSTLAQSAVDIAQGPLIYDPGTEFYYGGLGSQVAGAVAEVASGKPWAQLFAERLQGPLGMTNTTYGSSANPVLAGGVISTARDYARFLQMFLDDGRYGGRQILSPKAVHEMMSDQTNGVPIVVSVHSDGRRYGLGVWRDLVDSQGNPIQLSSQGDTGFSPWIDRQRGLVGVFATEDGLGSVYSLVGRMQEAARQAVDSAVKTVAVPSQSQASTTDEPDGMDKEQSAGIFRRLQGLKLWDRSLNGGGRFPQ